MCVKQVNKQFVISVGSFYQAGLRVKSHLFSDRCGGR